MEIDVSVIDRGYMQETHFTRKEGRFTKDDFEAIKGATSGVATSTFMSQDGRNLEVFYKIGARHRLTFAVLRTLKQRHQEASFVTRDAAIAVAFSPDVTLIVA